MKKGMSIAQSIFAGQQFLFIMYNYFILQMPTRLLVLYKRCKVHKRVKLSTKRKTLIKGKTEGTTYKTGPICTPEKKSCSK